MTIPEKEFYRVKEICAYLGIGRTALWKAIKAKRIPELERLNDRVAGYSRTILLLVAKNYRR